MLRIAGNTAGPIGLKFCVGTHGLGVLKVKKKFGKKKFCPIGPAVFWAAIGNIYICECLVLFYRYGLQKLTLRSNSKLQTLCLKF